MSSYMQGQLALNHYPSYESNPTQAIADRRRRKALKHIDKFRYLLIIMVLVSIAMLITWRYVQIYQMETSIFMIQKELKQMQVDNQELKRQVEQLQSPERLKLEATKLGLVPRNVLQVAQISPSHEEQAVAFNP